MTLEQLADLLFHKKQPTEFINDAPKPEFDERCEMSAAAVAAHIVDHHLQDQQDFYWFLIEEYDRIHYRAMGFNEHMQKVLPFDPGPATKVSRAFPLKKIEHFDRRSAESYVGKPNPGVEFLDREAMPRLRATYSEGSCNWIRAYIYYKFREIWLQDIDRLRAKYAAHYGNNCIRNGDMAAVALWQEVLDFVQ